MKISYLLLICLLICQLACAQQIVWERTFGSATSFIRRCEPLPDGGFALLLIDGFDVSLSRLDAAGIEQWNEPIGGGAYISTLKNCFLKAVPGGILAGMSQIGTDTIPVLLVKYDWQGTELWRKTLRTGRMASSPWEINIRSENEYLLLASGSNYDQTNSQGGGEKYVAFSLDSTGNVTWRKNYLNPWESISVPSNIIQYKTNGYLLFGDVSLGGLAPQAIKTDEQGNQLDQVTLFNQPGIDYSTMWGNASLLSDRTFAFTGFNSVSDYSQQYILVSKADTTLNLLWTITHAEPEGNLASSRIIEMADSNLLLVTQRHNNNKITLIKISPQGQLLDTTYITTAATTVALSLMNCFLLPDGSLIYCGRDFLAKISNVGLPMTPTVFPLPVGVAESLIAGSVLGLAFPNPAESTVSLPYSLPTITKNASIHISELATGRLVKKVTLKPESDQVKVGLQHLNAGVYTYTLFIEGVPIATKKLVVFK